MIQYVPIPALTLFDVVGEQKNTLLDQFFIMSLAYGLTAMQVQLIKHTFPSPRPDGNPNSFPSGHTATAFVGAHIIYHEFKDTNKWFAYSGYPVGALTASLRVAHDRHWVCDVLAGAGVGILSAELAYLIYFPLKRCFIEKFGKAEPINASIYPFAHSDRYGLCFAYHF